MQSTEQKIPKPPSRHFDSERRKKSSKKNEISTFINKTFRILEDKEISEIISWTDNGNSFIVKNKEKFESTILPKYFKHRKFSSFVRQLNMYDFHKLRKEKEIPIFRHKYFKMNKRELLKKIKRKCIDDGAENEDKDEPLSMNHRSSEPQPSHEQVQDQLENLARENQQLYKEIQYLQNQYIHFQDIQARQKEKCLKIINSMLYFSLENEKGEPIEKYSLRSLAQHFLNNNQDAFAFEEYRNKMSSVFRQTRERIIDSRLM